jgi:hypothetical protein
MLSEDVRDVEGEALDSPPVIMCCDWWKMSVIGGFKGKIEMG